MAQSTVIKNFRDGTLVFTDNTGTPLSLPIVYEAGDFSIDNLNEGLVETTAYLDRGEFATLRKTNRVFPSFSFTAIDFSGVGCRCPRLLPFSLSSAGPSMLRHGPPNRG